MGDGQCCHKRVSPPGILHFLAPLSQRCTCPHVTYELNKLPYKWTYIAAIIMWYHYPPSSNSSCLMPRVDINITIWECMIQRKTSMKAT